MSIFYKLLGRIKGLLLCIVLFLIFLPISSTIKYQQNDEYTHYSAVSNFLQGNFLLPNYISNTFYTQGILGLVWAKIFSLSSLPVLTLVISTLCVYFFYLLIKENTHIKDVYAFIISLTLLINPIFLYSTLGFMSENYFLLFLLISVLFITKYLKTYKPKFFVLSNIFIFVDFLVKQVSLVTSASFFVVLVVKKKFKPALFQLLILITNYLFYELIFPKSSQMRLTFLSFKNLFNVPRSLTGIYMIFGYVIFLCLPMILIFMLVKVKKYSQKKAGVFILLSCVLFILFKVVYKPALLKFNAVLWNGKTQYSYPAEKFPFFENTFGQKGLYEENLKGYKYSLYLAPNIYELFSKSLKVLIPILIAFLILEIKNIFGFELIYLLGMCCFILVLPKVFDRYIISISPIFTILVLKNINNFNFKKLITALVVLIPFIFMCYQYVMDFHLVNKYVWSRAEELNTNTGVSKNLIQAGHSWIMTYVNPTQRYNYIFEYAGTEKQLPGEQNFILVEKHKIQFPLSIYRDPYVYLYKRLN